MLMTVNGRKIMIIRMNETHVVWCGFRSGKPLLNSEKLWSKNDFNDFIEGPKGAKMKYIYKSVYKKECIHWHFPK